MVTWIDFGNYIDYYILKGQFVDDLGNKIGSEFQIISYPTSLYMYMKDTASNSDNHFIVYSGFESDNETNVINGHLIDLTGNIINPVIQIATSNSPAYDPNVISNGDNYFAVWPQLVDSDQHIFAQLFDNEGNK